MATKKEITNQEKKVSVPTGEIEEGMKIVGDTTEDILTQATKAVGTVLDLSKQASKLATSIGMGTTKDATSATSGFTKGMGNATNTMMRSSIDVLNAGSDALKTTAHIGVNAMNNSIALTKDLGKVIGGVVLLVGELLAATGEIVEVSGKMIKTTGRLVESTGKIFK